MFPWKTEVVIVAAAAVCQYTFDASAPPAMTTLRPVPVRAPVPSVPILKIQVSLGPPVSVNVAVVNVNPASKQWVPGTNATAPVNAGFAMAVVSHAVATTAVYALKKSTLPAMAVGLFK
jgi:hypothetical protein